MNQNARHKYTYFKLYKHNIDTFNALFRLSKVMGISNKLFSTAGLNDKEVVQLSRFQFITQIYQP